MSTVTAPPESWQWHKVTTQELPMVTPPVGDSTRETHVEVDVEHARRIIEERDEQPRPDPTARRRWAQLLQGVTGWEIFPEVDPDRLYVSHLWAEDWNSPEDSRYDD